MHVTVTIEGPRARTLVDHVFRNPHDRQLEGAFEYPLPTGASPSYFAMFLGQTREAVPTRLFGRPGNQPTDDALSRMSPTELVRNVDTTDWGRLQEARIVSKEKALETYEDVVRGRIDPALLEYAGGNTFRGRVFPIAPKGYNRVLIAYEELLTISSDRMVYRFPLPGRQLSELKFSLQTRTTECKEPRFQPAGANKDEGGGQVSFSRIWKEEKPRGEVVFSCTPANPRIQAITGQQGENGPLYVYVRLRPEVPTIEKGPTFSDHAVFLLDTSLSEHPDRFNVNMKLLQRILESDPDIKHFNVLTFNVGSAWLEPKGWLPNSAEDREKVLARLNGLLLEGATDVSCALEKLAQPGFEVAAGTPLNCFMLSDGQITWGNQDVTSLAARFERRSPFLTRFHCYRTGLGAENLELFETLTRKGGGIFNCPLAGGQRPLCPGGTLL
jgi:von Willebrand factor type A domain/Vault protein inter-alpha-trypsin domain